MRKPSKAAIKTLDRLIWRLERWQIRHAKSLDPAGNSGVAKTELMALIQKLENARAVELTRAPVYPMNGQ